MTHRATFTLDQEAYSFLLVAGKDNKSAFINDLLKKERQKHLKQTILKSNLEEAKDLAYQDELSVWDETLMDDF
jgi:antitoxin CcdA